MRFICGLIALFLACILCGEYYPDVSREFQLLAISIMVAGAMAGGD